MTGVTPDNLGLDISEYQPLVQYGNTLNLDTLKPSTDLANQWLESTRDPETTLCTSKYQFRAAFVFVVIWIKGNCSAGAKSGPRSTGNHVLAREPKCSAFGSRLLPTRIVKLQPQRLEVLEGRSTYVGSSILKSVTFCGLNRFSSSERRKGDSAKPPTRMTVCEGTG